MKQAPRAKASPAAGGYECAEQALVGRAEPAVQQGSVHDKHVQLRIFSARCGFLGTEPHRKPRSIYLESRTALSTTPPAASHSRAACERCERLTCRQPVSYPLPSWAFSTFCFKNLCLASQESR